MSSKTDLIRVVGVSDVPSYAGFQLQALDNGVLLAPKVSTQRSKASQARSAHVSSGDAIAQAVSSDVLAVYMTSSATPFVVAELRLHRADVHAPPPLNEERGARLLRLCQLTDGDLLQRRIADLDAATVEQLAAQVDPSDDAVVAHAHAPCGTARDGAALACYVTRNGSALVVDAGNVVYDVRLALAVAVVAARSKRSREAAGAAAAASSSSSSSSVASLLDERDQTLCVAAAWSRAVDDKSPLYLFVSTRSGRVAALRFGRAAGGGAYERQALIELPGAANERGHVTALLVTNTRLFMGALDGSVVAMPLTDLRAEAPTQLLLPASPTCGDAVLAIVEHATLGEFVARGVSVVSLAHAKLRWRAHTSAITGLSGGAPYGVPALVTCSLDGSVHFWPIRSTDQAPEACTLRQAVPSPAVGCVLCGNTIALMTVCAVTVAVSFAVFRETGRIALLTAPWTAMRGALIPRIDFALPPSWGYLAPLLNSSLIEAAIGAARAIDIDNVDPRGLLHAFLAIASLKRSDLRLLRSRAQRGALRAHARQVLAQCGDELDATARALFSFAPDLEIECPVSRTPAKRAEARVLSAEDELRFTSASGHVSTFDGRTMSPLIAIDDALGFCPICRATTATAAPPGSNAAVLLRRLPELFSGVGGTVPVPHCVYCRVPVLPHDNVTLPLQRFVTADVVLTF
jgi:hypothetical protein